MSKFVLSFKDEPQSLRLAKRPDNVLQHYEWVYHSTVWTRLINSTLSWSSQETEYKGNTNETKDALLSSWPPTLFQYFISPFKMILPSKEFSPLWLISLIGRRPACWEQLSQPRSLTGLAAKCFSFAKHSTIWSFFVAGHRISQFVIDQQSSEARSPRFSRRHSASTIHFSAYISIIFTHSNEDINVTSPLGPLHWQSNQHIKFILLQNTILKVSKTH